MSPYDMIVDEDIKLNKEEKIRGNKKSKRRQITIRIRESRVGEVLIRSNLNI